VTDAQQREELDTLRKEARAALDIGCGWLLRALGSTDDAVQAREHLSAAAACFEQLSTLALQLREQAATRMLRLPPNS